MTARLAAAWQLRHDVHAWLRAHHGSVMQDVFAAFPGIAQTHLRKCMQKLVRDLDVAMVNTTGNKGRYRAITEQIRPLAETIERMRESGRRNQHHAVRGCLVKAGKVAPIDDAIAKARADLKALEKARRDAAREAKRAAMKAAREAARLEKQREEAEAQIGLVEVAPGHWRYSNARGKPIANQGGQGAVRSDVTVNCSHNY